MCHASEEASVDEQKPEIKNRKYAQWLPPRGPRIT
jgi:hypothetical protein